MAVRITTNKGKNKFQQQGNAIVPFNRLVVTATGADVALLNANTIFDPGVLNYGTTFQLAKSSGTLKIELTLMEEEVVKQDATGSQADWFQLVAALANGAMQTSTFQTFSFMRLTFTAAGKCYIGAS